MTRPTLTRICQVLLLTTAVCTGVTAWAEKADRDKPMNVEADTLRHEDGRQTSVFTGNVVATKGTIVIELYNDEAPKTVANFIKLSKQGFYDGIIFHRVIPGFMIQGGDPTGTGSGGPGYDNAADVFTVDGGTATSTASPNNPGGRVRAMLTPVPKADANATSPANSPSPVLKPIPSMGQGKQ